MRTEAKIWLTLGALLGLILVSSFVLGFLAITFEPLEDFPGWTVRLLGARIGEYNSHSTFHLLPTHSVRLAYGLRFAVFGLLFWALIATAVWFRIDNTAMPNEADNNLR